MDKEELDNILVENGEDSAYLQELVDSIVEDCCGSLNRYVEYISNSLRESSGVVTDSELDDIIMTIPSQVYFVSETQEKIGLKGDVADIKRKQIFNDYFLKVEGTVQQKKSAAENYVINDDLIGIVYSRAYNEVKQKVSIALEILQSAKKVLSRRMLAMELSRSTPNADGGFSK